MRSRLVLAVVLASTLGGPRASLAPLVFAQGGGRSPSHGSADQAAAMTELLGIDQKIANAVIRGETAYVDSVTPADFVMVHGDGWTNGGKPRSTDTKASMLRRVTNKAYDVLDFDSVKVETHGDVAITYGRYVAHMPGNAPAEAWFSVWYERVYAKRDGKWIYLSHRTVHGPTFGPDRASVKDK